MKWADSKNCKLQREIDQAGRKLERYALDTHRSGSRQQLKWRKLDDKLHDRNGTEVVR